MTITNSIFNDLPASTTVGNDPRLGLETARSRDCRFLIDCLVRGIESPAVKELVRVVFDDLLRLLECLELIERHLRKIEFAEQTFELFQLIHDDARTMVEFIHSTGLQSGEVSDELFDTLDGIAFAVNHDLQRVFESNAKAALVSANSPAIVGKLYRAHDVLTNCLQQSAITLAMNFDSQLDGGMLFNNSDMRFRQSLQLCEDLGQLIQLVVASEKDPTKLDYSDLVCGIQRFRNESMELLMYTDWPQFENLCEKIDSPPHDQHPGAAHHQFRCYLETLLGQVRMRAVLANVFPLGFGDDHFSSPHSLVSPTADREFGLDSLAVAV